MIKDFEVKHEFKDSKGTKLAITQMYSYAEFKCPNCDKLQSFLFPAINKCKNCSKIWVFCAINEKTPRLGIWGLDYLKNGIIKDEEKEKIDNILKNSVNLKPLEKSTMGIYKDSLGEKNVR